jgi:hypothetical protein
LNFAARKINIFSRPACGTPVQAADVLFSGFVRVLENLESHGISIFQNAGLEILENQF